MIVANGSTDVTTYFVLRDSTAHEPKTDVTVGDIDLYYLEQGAAMAAKVDATALAAADSAHTDNYGFHCGLGLYRIDWPDAAFDGGAGKRVYLIVVCADVDTTFLEVELSPNVNTNSLTAGTITAAAIADAAIDAATFAANAITSTVIADDAITAAKLNTGAITADAFAADAIVAATLATGALTADAFAADALVAATFATDCITNDALAATAVTEITDGIWDATLADHLDVGSTGAALNAAGSAGDPWNTAIPGAYGAGTAGLLLGTTIPTAIDAIPTAAENRTEMDSNSTKLSDILADTDDIGIAGAGLTALAQASVCTETRLAELDAANLPTDIAGVPTTAEFEARTLPSADYVVVTDTIAGVTLCGTCTTNTDMRGTDNAALAAVCTEGRLAELDAANLPTDIADIPTTAEFNARTLPSADYVVVGDTIAGVTLCGTCTTNTDMRGTDNAALEANVEGHVTNSLNSYDPPTKAEMDTALAALNDITVADILAGVIEGAITVQQVMAVTLALAAGKSTGSGTATPEFRNQADDTDRIAYTIDGSGDRTTVLDFTDL